jgi:hypothetical protein
MHNIAKDHLFLKTLSFAMKNCSRLPNSMYLTSEDGWPLSSPDFFLGLLYWSTHLCACGKACVPCTHVCTQTRV